MNTISNARRTALFAAVASAALTLAVSGASAGELRLDLEAASVWQARNDFAVPGDGGTLVRLPDSGPRFGARATLEWDFGTRWSARFLAAPLSLDQRIRPQQPVEFQGETFAAGEEISVHYRFDSYRATLFYRPVTTGAFSYRIGGTLKVRSAEIALTGTDQRAAKTDLGVVPLLYGGIRWQGQSGLAVDLEADAAAAPQGRAIDAALRVELPIGERVRGFVGARVLDGGADNDEVNSFALFASAIAGVRVRL